MIFYAWTDEGSLDKTTERDGADADENGMVPLSDYNAVHEEVAALYFLFCRVKATIPIEGYSGIVIMLQSTNSNKVTRYKFSVQN